MPSVPSQATTLDFAPIEFVGKDGVFADDEVNWKRLPALSTNMGSQTRETDFSFELGDVIVTPDTVREAQFFAGTVDLHPRLQETFGWLLFAALGNVETTVNKDVDGNTVTGVFTHRFRFDPDSSYVIPWLAWRVSRPSGDGADDRGEIAYDCLINSLAISINQMGKIAAKVSVQGRTAYWDNDYINWPPVTNTYEYGSGVPEAGRGQFKLGGVEYMALGANLEFVNNLSNLQEEMIIGSFNPISFIPKSRAATVGFMSKYQNNKLAQKVETGTEDGTNWSNLPSYVETAGSVKAVDIRVESPVDIPGTSHPYRLIIQADRAALTRRGAPQLQPGSVISEGYELKLLRPADGGQFLEIIIENGVPDYTWAGDGAIVAALIMRDAVNYNGTPLYVDPASTIIDPDFSQDGPDVATLGLQLSGADLDVGDSLVIAENGAVSLNANDVLYNGVIVGTWSGDGSAGDELVIEFNEDSSLAAVQAILRTVVYERTGGSDAADVVTVTVNYLTGNDAQQETITITHVAP